VNTLKEKIILAKIGTAIAIALGIVKILIFIAEILQPDTFHFV